MATQADNDLKLILIGKTGHGKSSLGNSIAGQDVFEVSFGTHSKTKDVSAFWVQQSGYNILVVDLPGLKDTALSEKEDEKQACNCMTQALMKCGGGVHAFLLAFRFGVRITREEKAAILELKTIFGSNFLKDHGIIVLMDGDKFKYAMRQAKTPGKTKIEWCEEQDEIFKECSQRIVFINNFAEEEEMEQQRNELLWHAGEIKRVKGLYTNEHFKRFADIREQMQNGEPLLNENIQRSIDYLLTDLERISESTTKTDLEHLETQINSFNREILDHNEHKKSVQDLKNLLKNIESSIKELKTAIENKNVETMGIHINELQKYKSELKAKKEIPWKIISAWVLTFIGIGLGCAGVGLVGVAGASAVGLLIVISRALALAGHSFLSLGALCASLPEGLTKIMKKMKKEEKSSINQK